MKILAIVLHAILSMPIISYFLKKILPWWQRSDVLPPRTKVDAVVIISYGTHQTDLTEGSQAVLERALETGRYRTVYFFGVFRHNMSCFEKIRKILFLQKVPWICVGEVTSTTDECESILKKIKEKKPETKVIVVSAEGAHTPRARLVWQYFLPHYLPQAQVYMVTSNARLCADQKNPMYLQRYWQVWLVFNMFFYPLYKYFPGVRFFARLNPHQSS